MGSGSIEHMFEYMATTPGYTARLVATDPTGMDRSALRDVIVECQKAVEFARATQLAAMVELSRQEDADGDADPYPLCSRWVGV